MSSRLTVLSRGPLQRESVASNPERRQRVHSARASEYRPNSIDLKRRNRQFKTAAFKNMRLKPSDGQYRNIQRRSRLSSVYRVSDPRERVQPQEGKTLLSGRGPRAAAEQPRAAGQAEPGQGADALELPPRDPLPQKRHPEAGAGRTHQQRRLARLTQQFHARYQQFEALAQEHERVARQ